MFTADVDLDLGLFGDCRLGVVFGTLIASINSFKREKISI